MIQKKILLFISLTISVISVRAQGVSFSYLIPKNGYLSAPVSPFSLRGIGIGDNAGLETGFSLYNIPGLSMDNLPFDSDKPLTGPHFSVLVPAEVFFKIPLGDLKVKLSGGGFTWWNINSRINEGNMDRGFRKHYSYKIINTDFSLDNKLGFGWLVGVDFEFPINRDVSINFGGHYLDGGVKTGLNGSYVALDQNDQIINESINLPVAEILLQGFELSIGVQF